MQNNNDLVLDIKATSTPEVVYEGQIDENGMPIGDMPQQKLVESPYVRIPTTSNVWIKSELNLKQQENLRKGILTKEMFAPYKEGHPREIRLVKNCPSIDVIWQEKNNVEIEDEDLLGLVVSTGEWIIDGDKDAHVKNFLLNTNVNGSNPNRNPNSPIFFNVIDTDKALEEAKTTIQKQQDNTAEALQIIVDANKKEIAFKVLESLGVTFSKDEKLATKQLLESLNERMNDYYERLGLIRSEISKKLANEFLKTKSKISIVGSSLVENKKSGFKFEIEGLSLEKTDYLDIIADSALSNIELYNTILKF